MGRGEAVEAVRCLRGIGLIALIPCRSGSKRIPGKNFRDLGGRPLLDYTAQAAHESGVFEQIVYCTDSPEKVFSSVAFRDTCPELVLYQKPPLHRDECADVEWLTDALLSLARMRHVEDQASVCASCSLGSTCLGEIAILRPTSPFRGAGAIRRAKNQWDTLKDHYDSMRAITPAPVHPFKTWSYDPESHELWALMKVAHHKHMHSRPTQTLGDFYAQTASLEMSWAKTAITTGTIAGDRIAGFLTEGPEALDLNTPKDWEYAEHLVAQGKTCP